MENRNKNKEKYRKSKGEKSVNLKRHNKKKYTNRSCKDIYKCSKNQASLVIEVDMEIDLLALDARSIKSSIGS